MGKKTVIRVLQVVPNMQAGGLENLIMNLYRHIDRDKIQFDFIVHYSKPNFFDEEIKRLGGKIHYLTFRDDGNVLKYIKDLYRILKENKYTIIHSHMASLAFIHLGVAKICGVKTRIVHSHNSSSSKSFKGLIKSLLLKIAPVFANNYFACSYTAGHYLFGNKKFHVVNNAIDLKKFTYSEENRIKIRTELGIGFEAFVVGHTGRFNIQKNHAFLLRMFKECVRKNKNTKLILIGDGELKHDIKEQICNLGIADKVILTGVRDNLQYFYSAFDVFVLPSLFEGLPLTGIEAQACGIPCLFSTEVTKEVNLLPTTSFLSLKVSPQEWAEKIIEMSKINRISETKKYMLKYDITHEAKKMEEWYLSVSQNVNLIKA